MADSPLVDIAIAVGVQDDYSTPSATISALDSGTITAADGIVYGAAGFGFHDTGINMPVALRVGVPQYNRPGVSPQYHQRDVYIRAEHGTLDVTFALVGPGAPFSPAEWECQPDKGIDALYQAAGLTAALAIPGQPLVVYTPTLTGDVYCTVRIWAGLVRWTFAGCVVERLAFKGKGGEAGYCTASIRLGWVSGFADGWSVDEFTYGYNDTVTPKILKGTSSGFGSIASLADYTWTIENDYHIAQDSGQPSGERVRRTRQTLVADLSGYMPPAFPTTTDEMLRKSSDFGDTLNIKYGNGYFGGDQDNASVTLSFSYAQITEWEPVEIANVMGHRIRAEVYGVSTAAPFTIIFN